MNDDYKDWILEKIIELLPSGYSRVGEEINCRCPICGDSKKNSLKKRGYLSLKSGAYYCWNCGVAFRSPLKLLSILSGDDFPSIRGEFMKLKYGKSPKKSTQNNCIQKERSIYDLMMNQKSVIKPEWKLPLSEKATKYLDGRLVTKAPFFKETMYSFMDKNKNEYILIPWMMNSVDSYFQLNDFQKISKSGRKYIFPKNMDKMLYGIDNIDMSWKHIIVTEGVYDSLFIPNCVCSGGKCLTDLQYRILTNRFPGFEISLSYDNDSPGIEGMKSAIRKYGNRLSYFIWFNKNVEQKDINDYVLFKNDPNVFSDRNKIEKMIFNSIMARLKMDSLNK